MRSNDLLTIGEVSARTGVSVSALHFYERHGLISSTRSAGNQRRFSRHMLRRISLILVAKRLGIPLAEVADAFASLPTEAEPSSDDWKRVSRAWKIRLEERRAAIESLERELVGCIGCGCLSMRSCDLLNPGDALGAEGSGPRRVAPALRHVLDDDETPSS
ncbi:redox-sensitive transcriptional activator SoxR [Microbacterium sp. AISO3]|uniref:Redox-sensitive transcriptional activator SoxR n=1 Tax=Microbacterium arborescens TaxID=33883 RepID=A0ABX2WLE6_9MICO|nr:MULTISPECIES: redox-sensitive transcriptional activator SoxR [Microbacterium]APF34978.1 redox-sensitive transcriptional activator SoxR [Microbacterium paludicola]OAZ43990.1 redox-sensitive transcriptional activator SoxR [Microbacterium arborescens]OWP21271.1 redox-sensitive transcriptional activator SoxR [Microbacterium sp. AISO3]QCR41470.1 redox-sensitive transcriptional activator SoxR [Microbacterium sp. SGAir0570]